MVRIGAGRQPMSVIETLVGQEVSVRGLLDVYSVPEIRVALHETLNRGVGDLLVHLADAEVLDATGLGMIVGVHYRARQTGRRLVLADVSPRLDRLLRASRLHRVLARGSDGGQARQMPSGFPPVVGFGTQAAVVCTQGAAPSSETSVVCAEAMRSPIESVSPCAPRRISQDRLRSR